MWRLGLGSVPLQHSQLPAVGLGILGEQSGIPVGSLPVVTVPWDPSQGIRVPLLNSGIFGMGWIPLEIPGPSLPSNTGGSELSQSFS